MDFLNRVFGGMFKDADNNMQPNNTVKDVLNGTLQSDGNGTFGYECVKGNKYVFSLPTFAAISLKFVPIAYACINDENSLYIFSALQETYDWGMINKVVFDQSDASSVVTTLYVHDDFLSTAYPLKALVVKENPTTRRLYWTDRNLQPKSLNIDGSIATIIPTNTPGSLTNGQSYMVIGGTATYDDGGGGVTYAPGDADGNIFTANTLAGNSFFTGTATVIPYLPLDLLDFVPLKKLTQPYLKSVLYDATAAVPCGSKSAVYRLRYGTDVVTSWSPVCTPFMVGPDQVLAGGFPTYATYATYQGDGENGTFAIANKKCTIQIGSDTSGTEDYWLGGIDQRYDTIEVAIVEYSQVLNTISGLQSFVSTPITDHFMTFEYKGQNIGTSFTVSDIIIFNTTIEVCKDITSFKQYLIPVNLTERKEFQSSVPKPTIGPIIKTSPADSQLLYSTVNTNNTPLQGVFTQRATTIGTVYIEYGQEYIVSGDSITYNGVLRAVGVIFTGAATPLYTTTSGASVVKAIIRIRQYSNSGGKYKTIYLEDELPDHKGSIVNKYLKGYWRGETYRMGILFFDKYGNPFYVRWLGDVTMPKQSDSSTYRLMDTVQDVTAPIVLNDNAYKAAFRNMGVGIDGLDITDIIAELGVSNISGFSIVRCPRDKRIMCQGIMFPTLSILADSLGDGFINMGLLRFNLDTGATLNSTQPQNNIFSYHSPDMMFDDSPFIPTYEDGDSLEAVATLTPLLDNVTSQYYTEQVATDNVYSKMYTCGQYGSYVKGQLLAPFRRAQVGESVDDLFDGLAYYDGEMTVTAAPLLSTPAKSSAGINTLLYCQEANFYSSTKSASITTSTAIWKPLVNYVKQGGLLYGGQGDAALANSAYMFCDHYQPINASVLADVVTGGRYIFNGIEVFGGDCNLNIVDFARNVTTGVGGGNFFQFGILFPCESNINYQMRQGRTLSKDGLSFDPATNSVSPANGRYEEFIVNNAYSSQNVNFLYPALPVNFNYNNVYPYRGRHSEVKRYGEPVDSWRIFKPNNYIDVDAFFGQINNVEAAIDRVFYWQDNGVGSFPINERALTTNAFGAALNLGTGGVMERYDTQQIYFGNQHQWGLFKGPNWFQWFDMRNRVIARMTFGGAISDVSTNVGLKNFFDTAFNYNPDADGTILDSDNPILTKGINGVYDQYYNLALQTFSQKKILDDDVYHTLTSFTIGITDKGVVFGFFSPVPGLWIKSNGQIFSADTLYPPIIPLFAYLKGDIVRLNGINYICKSDFTTASPAVSPASDTTNWAVLNNVNDLFWANRGNYCQFYNKVYPFKVEFMLRDDADTAKVLDMVERIGNLNNFLNVYVETEQGTVSDLAIPATSKNYKYYNGKWYSNIPFLRGGRRLTGTWFRVTFEHDNQSGGSFTTALNKLIKVISLRSIFREKQ